MCSDSFDNAFFLYNTKLRTLLTNNLSTYLSKYKKSNVYLYNNVK